MGQWVASNPARTRSCRSILCNRRTDGTTTGSSRSRTTTAAVASSARSAGSFCPEPGVQHPVGNDVSKVSVSGPSAANTGWLIVNTTVHPVQGSSHELGHWLTLPHAGSATGPCKNAPLNETWPGDDSGRLQGVRFNPATGFRATPAVDGTPSARVIYDFMTYCGDFRDRRPKLTQTRRGTSPAAYPGNTWLSARNWQRVAAALDAMAVRLHLKLQQFPGGGLLPHPRQGEQHRRRRGRCRTVERRDYADRADPGPDRCRVGGDLALPAALARCRRQGLARRGHPHPAPGGDPHDVDGRCVRGAGGTERVGGRTRLGRPGAGAQGSLAAAARHAAASAPRDPSPPRAEAVSPLAWFRPGLQVAPGDDRCQLGRRRDLALRASSDRIAAGSACPRPHSPGSKRERVRVTLNDGFSAATAHLPTFKAPGSPRRRRSSRRLPATRSSRASARGSSRPHQRPRPDAQGTAPDLVRRP